MKRAGDRAGSRRHAPRTQRLPAHPIMTELPHTGTHAKLDLGLRMMDPGSAAHHAAFAARLTQHPGNGNQRCESRRPSAGLDIQHAAASPSRRWRLGILDRPLLCAIAHKADDDDGECGAFRSQKNPRKKFHTKSGARCCHVATRMIFQRVPAPSAPLR